MANPGRFRKERRVGRDLSLLLPLLVPCLPVSRRRRPESSPSLAPPRLSCAALRLSQPRRRTGKQGKLCAGHWASGQLSWIHTSSMRVLSKAILPSREQPSVAAATEGGDPAVTGEPGEGMLCRESPVPRQGPVGALLHRIWARRTEQL